MTKETNWPSSKCELIPHCRPLLELLKKETIPITIDITILRKKESTSGSYATLRAGPSALGLDVYGSMNPEKENPGSNSVEPTKKPWGFLLVRGIFFDSYHPQAYCH